MGFNLIWAICAHQGLVTIKVRRVPIINPANFPAGEDCTHVYGTTDHHPANVDVSWKSMFTGLFIIIEKIPPQRVFNH